MSIPIIIAAADAGAKVAEVSGGMSLVSPQFIYTLLTGIAGIISTAMVYFKMKGKAETKVRRPLDHEDVYVTHGECKRLMCGLEHRVDEIGPAINRIFVKLCENDKRSEDRTIRLHERLEPVIEKVAENSGKIEMLVRAQRRENEKPNA